MTVRADTFQIDASDDPRIGVHLTLLDADGVAIADAVLGDKDALALIEFVRAALYARATAKT